MSCVRALLPAVALTACSFHVVIQGDPDGSLPGGDDGARIDAPPAEARHLLLTEVGPRDPEFIEIYNPTSSTIDLSTYYLSDTNQYWLLPGHVAGHALATINVGNSDFVVRFPAAMLPPGGVATIAVRGSDYVDEYGELPTFTIRQGVSGATPMIPIVIPATGGTSLITDSGEMLALFQWDGLSDLVRDVDIVVGGLNPDINNRLAPKGVVDGPDPDLIPSAYLPDALTIGDMARDAGGSQTYKRIAHEDGHELASDGNGILGHDETSEQIRMTWDSGSSPATPGQVPAALR